MGVSTGNFKKVCDTIRGFGATGGVQFVATDATDILCPGTGSTCNECIHNELCSYDDDDLS